MKFKFRADAEDLLIFVLFAIFLLYIVAILVANVHTFGVEGRLTGINPFPAFSAECIKATILFYLISLLGLFTGVSSWFFEREKYGGILCDIGSHQIEQYLFYAGEEDADVVSSRIANFAHPDYPELEDFGDCNLTGKNGTANYFRVDWFTPDGLRTWGDGRMFIVGTEGFIEVRKYVNLASDQNGGCHVYVVNGKKMVVR